MVYNEYKGTEVAEGRLNKGKITFESCVVVNNSTCTVPGNIPASNILGRFGNEPVDKTSKVEDLIYTNAKYFATIKFGNVPGETCTLPSGNLAVTGGVIGVGEPTNTLTTKFIVNTKVITATSLQELKEIEFPAFGEKLTNQELKLGNNKASIEGELELQTAEPLEVCT